MQIKADKFYTPNEIIELGILTKAKSNDTRRQMVLRFIRESRVEYINLGNEKQPRYVVQGKHLIAYRDKRVKAGQYVTK